MAWLTWLNRWAKRRFPYLWRFPKTGWRRTAVNNTILVSILAAGMVHILAVSTSRAGGVNTNLILFEGDCAKSGRINLGLHLLLNVVGTLIISSSNFFMQVLNAPTRAEVDRAHARRSYLEIGVPSIRNIFHVSWFKTLTWASFAVSSVPIHLFFNSAVFETSYQGSEWHLTIADESFLNGANYYPPGASLLPSGLAYPQPSFWLPYSPARLGNPIQLEEYFSSSSAVVANISTAATRAKASWTILDPGDCRKEYAWCGYRQKYRDVVVIVGSSNTSFSGWQRSALYSAQGSNATFWDSRVPADERNSLWFSGQCTSQKNFYHHEPQPACDNSCAGIFGFIHSQDLSTSINPKTVDMDTADPRWIFDFGANIYQEAIANSSTGVTLRDPSVSRLDVQYCLAETKEPHCKVGVSNTLLLIVTICVLFKVIECFLVVRRLTEEPLVTPGDAVAEFLARPDSVTKKMCWLRAADVNRSRRRHVTFKLAERFPGFRPWKKTSRYLLRSIPAAVWWRSYIVLALALLGTAICLGIANADQAVNLTAGAFSHEDSLPYMRSTFFESVLRANMPQLALSLAYFIYNSFFTRVLVEKEWNSYSRSYLPLRVTAPRGEQISSYRLQLPYRWSVPLLVVSIAMHWLVSNTIYVFIIEGGYYSGPDGPGQADQPSLGKLGLSPDSAVSIGYSSTAIMIVLAISLALVIIPLAVSVWKMKGDMVLGGTNSMVISAACHAPRLLNCSPTSPLSTSETIVEKYNPASELGSKETVESFTKELKFSISGRARELTELGLEDVSRRKLRWGEIRMPDEFYEQFEGDGRRVGHLSFGIMEQDVREPGAGTWYM